MSQSIFSRSICLFLFFALFSTHSNAEYEKGVRLNAGPLMDNGFKICLIGDSGMHLPTQYWVAAFMKREDCDQVRVLGDIIYTDGIKNKDDLLAKTGFFWPYAGLLKDSPFYLALGNHDYKGNPDAWLDIAREDPRVVIPSRYYSEDWDDVCVVTLDSQPFSYGKWGSDELRAEQRAWLQAQKRDLQSRCRFSIAIGHHPYRSAGKHGHAKPNYKILMDNEVLGSFDIYLSGHDHHIEHAGNVKGTELLISGAAGFVYKLERDEEPGGYAGSHLGYITLTLQRTGEAITGVARLYKTGFGKKRVHKVIIPGLGIR